MRISLSLTAKNKIKLPVSYNYYIQSLVYNYIDDKLSKFLHDEGYAVGKRRFKLFTFSRIEGKVKFDREEKAFLVDIPFGIIISSPIEHFVQSLAENMVRSDLIMLCNQRLYLESINVYFIPELKPEIAIRMLSPVTVYSTLEAPDGRKKTYYFSPFEKEFSQLLEENLRKKYKALYQMEPDGLSFSIEPLGIGKKHEKIIDYKGTVIKGWMGKYKLKGSPELIKLAYDTGLGAKNSQGFGCFEIQTMEGI